MSNNKIFSKKVYNKKIYNRKRGSVFKIIPIFLGMTAITVMSIMFLHYMKDMDVREQASQITRKYLLGMEADGYLTETAEQGLLTELQGLGFRNISLSGTTMGNVGYGKEIILVVNAVIDISDFNVISLFDIEDEKKAVDFKVIRKSTAKN